MLGTSHHTLPHISAITEQRNTIPHTDGLKKYNCIRCTSGSNPFFHPEALRPYRYPQCNTHHQTQSVLRSKTNYATSFVVWVAMHWRRGMKQRRPRDKDALRLTRRHAFVAHRDLAFTPTGLHSSTGVAIPSDGRSQAPVDANNSAATQTPSRLLSQTIAFHSST